jgi:hypothetical protein
MQFNVQIKKKSEVQIKKESDLYFMELNLEAA